MKTSSNSTLKTIIQEAISSLEDTRIATLSVTSVDGSKNSSDVKVYILAEDFNHKDILKLFKKASKNITSYAFVSSGWVKFPRLSFYIDTTYDKQKRMEELFRKIKTPNSPKDETYE
ncbi:Ribosome-binding factor A [hydrothermal vent metagenome]|uniref:Ribosome-binding factor A n=1 Tax=hydrothermal vent metagenome TaxID=652676 RepID=A0A3B1E6X7_9ZZZZ